MEDARTQTFTLKGTQTLTVREGAIVVCEDAQVQISLVNTCQKGTIKIRTTQPVRRRPNSDTK